MVYDEDLADRIRTVLSGRRGITEKRMFGGLAFLIDGNMAVAVSGQGGLMVRVPAEQTEGLLTRAHVEPMVMSGRETRGWVRVSSAGLTTNRQLKPWIARGVDYAAGMPAK